MSDVRISQLPAADTPLSGAEIMPLVQDGITVKATVNQIGGVFSASNLQEVTNNGNTTTNDIKVNTVYIYDSINDGYIHIKNNDNGILIDQTTNGQIFSVQSTQLSFGGVNNHKVNLNNSLLLDDQNYEFPNKSGTIALTDDIVISTLQQVTAGTNKNLVNGLNFQGTNAGLFSSQTDINAFGDSAAKNNNAHDVNAFGVSAAENNTGEWVNAIGKDCCRGNHSQLVNGIGYHAAENNQGNNVNAIGYSAASSNNASDINALGNSACNLNTGSEVNALGSEAAKSNTGQNVNALGGQSAKSNTGQNVNALGYLAGNGNTFNNVTLLGNSAQATAAKQLVLADGFLNARISYTNISANRTYELPDVEGTFPVMSGTPTPPNWTGFIPRWVGQSNIGASTLLSDNSSTISIGNSSPSASARLQVDSTTSGFLPPRMPTANRNAISSPAEGLCVYDTTLHKLYVYDGTIWNACW